MIAAQKWLTDNYGTKNEEIIESGSTKLEEGTLKIADYPKLKKIFLSGAGGITELEIDNCPAVEVIFIADNQLTKIEGLEKLTELRKLSFGGNKVKEINISKNTKLEMLVFRNNPADLEFTDGIKNLDKLVDWNSYDTFPLTKIINQANDKELKEIAKELGLEVGEKNPDDIKKDIIDKIQKGERDKTKLKQELPDLFKNDEVDDKKLGEIKGKVEKGDKYQQLVSDPKNTPILNPDKTEIDPNKLGNELSKSNDYAELVKNNSDLANSDNTKIDQIKIDALKTASGDVKNAIDKLGVNDLKEVTLADKLGEAKLSDIPAPKTLKDILKENKALENALKGIGVDPNNTAEVEKGIRKLNGLVKRVKEIYGENYEDKLEVQEYQNYIEVNPNNRN